MTPKLQRDLTYQIVCSRRKTADIVLERDGSLVVRVPRELSAVQIDRIIDAKRLWIHRNLAEWRELNTARNPSRVPQWGRVSLSRPLVSSAACR
jgi:predicted metal-dependent hydrolase